jgi:hypothetical protein
MTFRCLLCIDTPSGQGFAVVHCNSLHQLALIMPGLVISYEVQEMATDPFNPTVLDDELISVLVGFCSDLSIIPLAN